MLTISGGLLLLFIGGLVWSNRSTDSIPASIRKSVDYSLYQPGWLPPKAYIQRGTFRATAGIVTFFITYDGNRQLAVTEQAKPAQFDFAHFYQTQIDGQKVVQTPIGRAVLGTFTGNSLASVTSDQTWVMLSAPDGIAATDLEHIVKSLH
jgi:hypothetical protein